MPDVFSELIEKCLIGKGQNYSAGANSYVRERFLKIFHRQKRCDALKYQVEEEAWKVRTLFCDFVDISIKTTN